MAISPAWNASKNTMSRKIVDARPVIIAFVNQMFRICNSGIYLGLRGSHTSSKT